MKNYCEACESNQFLFKVQNYCQTVSQTIPNCQLYNSVDGNASCVSCKGLTYYDQGLKKCQAVDIPECQVVDTFSPLCTFCDLNKNLVPNIYQINNKCVKIPDYLFRNCSQSGFEMNQNNYSCNVCEGQNYPRRFDNSNYSFCVYETQLIDFLYGLSETNLLYLDNCLSFRFVDKNKECVYCDQNNDKKVIQNNFCSTACSPDELAYTFYIETGGTQPYAFMKCKRQNLIAINESFSLENCKILDYDVSYIRSGLITEDQIPKGCVECLDGYKGYYNSSIESYWSHFNYLPARSFSTSGIYKKSFFSIWHKRTIYNSCLAFNKNMETANTKLFTFTKVQDITFPSLKNGFTYFTVAGISSVIS